MSFHTNCVDVDVVLDICYSSVFVFVQICICVVNISCLFTFGMTSVSACLQKLFAIFGDHSLQLPVNVIPNHFCLSGFNVVLTGNTLFYFKKCQFLSLFCNKNYAIMTNVKLKPETYHKSSIFTLYLLINIQPLSYLESPSFGSLWKTDTVHLSCNFA